MATAITNTSTTTTTCERYAEENHHPFFNLRQMYRAYLACRRAKRNKPSALAFEMNLEDNLIALVRELREKSYRPTTSICFYTEKPKRREIFAADFRDRVVHHLIYNQIAPRWEKRFIAQSYACRPGKGTHAAVFDLQKMLRKVSANGSRRAWFLKLDIRNFFMTIDRRILYELLLRRCNHPDLCWLLRVVVFHEPTEDSCLQDRFQIRYGLPPHKSLFHAKPGCGLPIGNLTSQFFANVYLNPLDQLVKHDLKCRFYLRYVDDLVLLSQSREELVQYERRIAEFVETHLHLCLNPGARRLAPVSGGVDFVGFIARPAYLLVRRRTLGNLKAKIRRMRRELVLERESYAVYWFDFKSQKKCLSTLNSYLAHVKHGRCHEAVAHIWRTNPFLEMYFRMAPGKAVDKFRVFSRGRLTLKKQIKLAHRLFEGYICLVQVGCYFEVFGGQAVAFANHFGFKILLNWRGWRYVCGFREGSLARVVKRCIRGGIALVIIRQTGRESAFAKERWPALVVRPKTKLSEENEGRDYAIGYNWH